VIFFQDWHFLFCLIFLCSKKYNPEKFLGTQILLAGDLDLIEKLEKNHIYLKHDYIW